MWKCKNISANKKPDLGEEIYIHAFPSVFVFRYIELEVWSTQHHEHKSWRSGPHSIINKHRRSGVGLRIRVVSHGLPLQGAI